MNETCDVTGDETGSTAGYTDGTWQTADGLRLHYRDYPARTAALAHRPPLLCLPGLTRNARDFSGLAQLLAGEWRVIAVDLRGRGLSDYAKDPASYQPLQYVADVLALFEQAGLERAVLVGTSLGGIITMLLAMQAPEKIAGAIINDIGPQLAPTGLARIRDHVGQARSYATWMHAARGLREGGSGLHPDFALADWLAHAKRLMVLGENGRIVYDYDMKIADPIHSAPADAVDLWPAFRSLAGRPVLALRGELSDLLDEPTFARMAGEFPGLTRAVVPRTGHAPTLAEPAAVAAITRFLEQQA